MGFSFFTGKPSSSSASCGESRFLVTGNLLSSAVEVDGGGGGGAAFTCFCFLAGWTSSSASCGRARFLAVPRYAFGSLGFKTRGGGGSAAFLTAGFGALTACSGGLSLRRLCTSC